MLSNVENLKSSSFTNALTSDRDIPNIVLSIKKFVNILRKFFYNKSSNRYNSSHLHYSYLSLTKLSNEMNDIFITIIIYHITHVY